MRPKRFIASSTARGPPLTGRATAAFARQLGDAQRSIAASSAVDNGAPLMSIVAKASSISRRSSAVSRTSAAGRLSSRCSIFVPPGIGTIHGFWASNQASAICPA